MTTASESPAGDTAPAWADRAADRSPAVHRSRMRSAQQARLMVQGARRLIETRGTSFTTQELVKEAGVALQTFYRHFAGKDQLLLAVFEDMLAEHVARVGRAAEELPDPVSRLRFLVTIALDPLRAPEQEVTPRFVTVEHWRLYQLFPAEVGRANKAYADLVERELRAAAAAGLLHPRDPAADAWLAMKLVMSVYHHYAFAKPDEQVEDIADRLWAFCLAAFGGTLPPPAAQRRPS